MVKLFERLDVMDKKLGQLESIQISLQNVTVKVSSMDTKVTNMESQLRDLERSREYDSKAIEVCKGDNAKLMLCYEKCKKLRQSNRKD